MGPPQRCVLVHVPRRVLLAAVCVISLAQTGWAQTSDAWQLGAGAAYGDELKLRGALLLSVDVSRRVFVTHGVGMAIMASAGYAPKESQVACPVSAGAPFFDPCDFRYVARVWAASLAADTRYAHPSWPLYAHASIGHWWGSDIGSGPSPSKWEHGLATALDAGARLPRGLSIGFQEQRLYGTRHGMLPLYGLVARAMF